MRNWQILRDRFPYILKKWLGVRGFLIVFFFMVYCLLEYGGGAINYGALFVSV